MKKKEYIKPTIERQAIFCNEFGVGMGGKTGQCLYLSKPQVDRPNYPIFEEIK